MTVPTSATAFSLIATYKDGYQVTKTGPIQQVDLVPNASVSPNPVLKSTTLTAKNLMQKAAAATLNSVAWQITPGGGSGTLGATFLPVNGTAGVTAPATTGNYNLNLTYNYTDHNGAPQSAQVQKPFQVTDFVPVPVLGVYKGANKTQPVIPFGGVYSLTTNTAYFLWDEETIPGGGTHPGAKFYRSSDQNQSIGPSDTLIGQVTGAPGPVNYNSGAAECSTNCYIKVEVSGSVKAFKIAIDAPGGGGCQRRRNPCGEPLRPDRGQRRQPRAVHGVGHGLPRHRLLQPGPGVTKAAVAAAAVAAVEAAADARRSSPTA